MFPRDFEREKGPKRNKEMENLLFFFFMRIADTDYKIEA